MAGSALLIMLAIGIGIGVVIGCEKLARIMPGERIL